MMIVNISLTHDQIVIECNALLQVNITQKVYAKQRVIIVLYRLKFRSPDQGVQISLISKRIADSKTVTDGKTTEMTYVREHVTTALSH